MLKKSLAFLLTFVLLLSVIPAMYASADDKISAADARLALRLAAKLDSSTRELDVIADVDKNGAVNASDARSILRVTAKLQTVFDSVDTNI